MTLHLAAALIGRLEIVTGLLILASSSPRRRELLAEACIPHEALAPDAAEDPLPGEDPRSHVLRCARAKASLVADRHPERLVLAADTVVVLDGRILGKPGSPERTGAMVRALAGRAHEVLSAAVLLRRSPVFDRAVVVTSYVTVRPLAEEEIEAYVATGDGFDKAGGYGIQSRGRELVAGYSGSYSNIVGLPMDEVRALLAEAGILSGGAGG